LRVSSVGGYDITDDCMFQRGVPTGITHPFQISGTLDILGFKRDQTRKVMLYYRSHCGYRKRCTAGKSRGNLFLERNAELSLAGSQ